MPTTPNRRKFLVNSLKTMALLPLASPLLQSCNAPSAKEESVPQGGKKLNILILGGTSFLGPHQIAYALGRGHKISTFTRGKTRPSVHADLFDQVESLLGDRADNLEALKGRKWDAVIDNSGRRVKWTEDTAKLLKDSVDLYVYTSSTGVFYPYLTDEIKEDYPPVLEMPDVNGDEEMELEYGYGIMKAKSEMAAKEHFGADRTIVVRPTYMIGPADKTDRFIHWPIRLNQGGEVLVPGKADDPIQVADVRDISEWMIRLIEQKAIGTYNAAGPNAKTGMLDFIKEANSAFEADNSLVLVDDYEFLKEQKIHYIVPWVMPEGNNWASSRISNAHAIAHGLTFRPLVETMKDTHAWWYSDAVGAEKRQAYLDNADSVLAREADILAAWKQRA
ncbi:MAG: NAD-dependent epimerase/dehydratase family protein [Bacteroidia bacterium]